MNSDYNVTDNVTDVPLDDDYYDYVPLDDDYYYQPCSGGDDGLVGCLGNDDQAGYGGDDDGNPYFPDENRLDDLQLTFRAFQDSRFLQSAIPTDANNPDFSLPGTVYLFTDAVLQQIDEIDRSPLFGMVLGSCIRTDLATDAFIGRAYCQFTYQLFDTLGESDYTVIASFSAEGPVSNDFSSSLVITGGTGGLTGAKGEVFLEASFIDDSGSLAVVDGTLDFLGPGADGYTMEANVYIDPNFQFIF